MGASTDTSVASGEPKARASALAELGLSLLAAGRWAEAEETLTRAVEIDPELATAWRAIGDLRAERGDEAGSREAYQRQIALGADDADLARAADALLAGNLGEAEQLCRALLKREPRNLAALRILAEVGVKLGRFEDAEALLLHCLELAPDFHPARLSYANLLTRTLRYREALREIDTALNAVPNRPSFLQMKASILAHVGDVDEAIRLYDAVLQQLPNEPRTHLNRGHALRTVGRHADAVAAYRKSIELQPSLGESYWSLANLKTFRFDDSDIAQMRKQLDSRSVSAEDSIHLLFALGKALEDAGRFGESFRY